MATTEVDNEVIQATADTFAKISEWISGDVYEAAKREGLTDLVDACNIKSSGCDMCADIVRGWLRESEENGG